ncbi:MAG: ATP-binding protein [Myxococcota bacterium]
MISRVREHRQGQVERLLLVLMGARLALALASLGIGLILDFISGAENHATSWPGFYVTVALCFVATLVYRPFVGAIRRPHRFGAINVATDLALVSALVLFSGGKDSVFTFLYVAVGLYSGVLFPGLGALLCSAVGSATYGLVLAIGAFGWLGPGVGSAPPSVLLTSWLVLSSGLFAAGGLAGFLARELVRAGRALDERTEDLLQLRTLHQHTVESLKSGLLTTDLTGHVTSFNQEAQRITGLSRSQALGRVVDEILPGLEALRCVQSEGGALSRSRMRFAGQEGRELHLGLATYVLRDGGGEARGEVVIFQDVTDVVAMEQELRRSERLAAVGELSASIAHEVRNPLAAISGSIQMMHAQTPAVGAGAESKRLMEIVVREVDRLDGLISDFLQFARPGETRREWVLVTEVFDGVLDMLEASALEGIEVECDVADGLEVDADPAQLRQVLWNLVNNAIQAMPDGGCVRIEARPGRDEAQEEGEDRRSNPQGKPHSVEICVLDQGVGVPPEVAEHMFDPFYTTKPRGTGLGLATVHRVIQEHRGVIRVTQGPSGFATKVEIRLPCGEGALA